MNCSQFRSKLQSLVEQRSSLNAADDGLRDHLSNCGRSECRQAWHELCLLDQAIRDWSAGFPELDLCERVVSELRSSAEVPSPAWHDARRGTSAAATAERPVREIRRPNSADASRHSLSRWIVVSVALFVLVSLIAIVTSSQPRLDGPVEPGEMAERELEPPSEVAPPAPESPTAPFGPSERQLAEADLSSAYLGIAEDATQFLTDTVALTLAGEEDIEDPTAAAEWIHQVQDRVGPWSDEFDAALDRFLGTLPDSESS